MHGQDQGEKQGGQGVKVAAAYQERGSYGHREKPPSGTGSCCGQREKRRWVSVTLGFGLSTQTTYVPDQDISDTQKPRVGPGLSCICCCVLFWFVCLLVLLSGDGEERRHLNCFFLLYAVHLSS